MYSSAERHIDEYILCGIDSSGLSCKMQHFDLFWYVFCIEYVVLSIHYRI